MLSFTPSTGLEFYLPKVQKTLSQGNFGYHLIIQLQFIQYEYNLYNKNRSNPGNVGMGLL